MTKSKMWEFLKIISLKPSSKLKLLDLLKIELNSLLNLIQFINNYSNKKVISMINDIVYLDKAFLFFVEDDFKNYNKNLNFEIINSIDSTNDLLIRYIKDSININNKVVIANEQTKGKGRLERKWVSSLGNSIMFSLGLNYFNKNLNKLISIPLIVSYSCVVILRKYKIPVQIKWPNDIVVDNLKLGGVLINSIKNSLVIGVGLNYNSISDIDTDTTFIKKYNNSSIKIILKEIIMEIFNNFKIFQEKGFKNFKNDYLYYLRDINNEVNIIHNNEIKHSGKIIGIGNKGELILQDNNSLHYIMSGDLSLRVKC